VEYPCYKCGASVEEGVLFCPQCNAPQIRVAGADLPPPPGTNLPPKPSFSYPGSLPGRIQWSQALPGAVIGGVVSAILMVIPLGALGLGMLIGGSLSVLLYHRRLSSATLTAGIGARLGALCGVIGFGMFTILAALEMLVRHNSAEFRAAIYDAMQQSASRSPGPQADELMAWMKTPPGLAFIVAFGLLVVLIFFVVVSSAGGAIGATLLRKREKH
jgi:hypothetical protein